MTGHSARQTDDNESDKAILGDLESGYTSKKPSMTGIMRPTRVSVDHVTSNGKSASIQGHQSSMIREDVPNVHLIAPIKLAFCFLVCT
jgi:hypothetical protein